MVGVYAKLPNELIKAPKGVHYAYCHSGSERTVPMVLFQHFRENRDSWEPALIDVLASGRRVVVFDNVRVGGSTGTTPDAIEQMACDASTAPSSPPTLRRPLLDLPGAR